MRHIDFVKIYCNHSTYLDKARFGIEHKIQSDAYLHTSVDFECDINPNLDIRINSNSMDKIYLQNAKTPFLMLKKLNKEQRQNASSQSRNLEIFVRPFLGGLSLGFPGLCDGLARFEFPLDNKSSESII